MNNVELNVFTWCDDVYSDYIPLFIVSNLYFIKDCFVEVCLDTNDQSKLNEINSLINEIYPNKFLVRNVKALEGFGKASIRFVIQPQVISKYVYISDIDMVNLQSDIVECHLRIMKENNLPYSNVRQEYRSGVYQNDPNKKMLSGLHFTPYENYYPIPNFEEIKHDLKEYVSNKHKGLSISSIQKLIDSTIKDVMYHDRHLLYHLVEKRFPNIHENTNTIRPVHGIHMSPNRDPYHKTVGWSLDAKWKRKNWIELVNSTPFKFIHPHLSDRLKNNIDLINEYYSREYKCI